MAPLVALIDEAGEWEEEQEEEEEEGEEEEVEEEKEGKEGKRIEEGNEKRKRRQRRRRRAGKPALRRAPESWEWLTVAIATCLSDCSGGCETEGAVVAVEEAVAVAFE